MKRYSIKGQVIFLCFPRSQNLPVRYVWYLHWWFSSLVLYSCIPVCVNEHLFLLFLLYISLKGCSFNMSVGKHRKERDIDNGAFWRHDNEWRNGELTDVTLLPQNVEFPQLVHSTSKYCTDFHNISVGFFVLFLLLLETPCPWQLV